MRQLISAEITANTPKSPRIFLLTLKAPAIAAAGRPGQFVNLYFQHSSKLFPRPFSIAGIQDDHIELLYKVIGTQTHRMSQWQSGDVVRILGPLGNAFRLPQCGNTAVLIAGGVGAAPLLFLQDRLTQQQFPSRFFLGARTHKEHFMTPDERPNLALSTDDGSLGFHGNVVDHFKSRLPQLKRPITIYACGPDKMNGSLKAVAAVHKCELQVSLETIMACGMGLCQGCATRLKDGDQNRYALVCKDGPVFDINELDLDG